MAAVICRITRVAVPRRDYWSKADVKKRRTVKMSRHELRDMKIEDKFRKLAEHEVA